MKKCGLNGTVFGSIVGTALLALVNGCGGDYGTFDGYNGGGEREEDVGQLREALGSSGPVQWIYNQTQLQAMAGNGNYKLANDIYLSGSFNPIGTYSAPFTGTLDGDNKVIHNLNINKPTGQGVGLFAAVDLAIIKKVGLRNVFVVGRSDVGGLAGNIRNSQVTDSFVEGTVSGPGGSASPGWGIGLFAGSIGNTGQFRRCYTKGTVQGRTTSIGGFVGEIYGYSAGDMEVSEVFTNTSVNPTIFSGTTPIIAGGVVGRAEGVWMKDIHSIGNVTGRTYVGGIIGQIKNDDYYIGASVYDQIISRGTVNANISGVNRAGTYGRLLGSFAHCNSIYDKTVDTGTPVSQECNFGVSSTDLKEPHFYPAPQSLGVYYSSDNHWNWDIWGLGWSSEYNFLKRVPNANDTSIQPR